MSVSIKKIGVCGAGTMGSGIAQVVATVGYKTILYDVNEAMLETAKKGIEDSIQKLEQKEKLPVGAAKKIINLIEFTANLHACTADIIIEAVIEEMEVKVSLFRQLMEINNRATIFASNTSSLSLTSLAQQLGENESIIGLHFFNPAPLMKLVEIVYTPFTKESTLQRILQFAKHVQKIPVLCKDAPGFIVNRVARPYYIEALRLVEEGKASVEIIDRLLEANGFKMGPFKLMDLIGNDINYAVSQSVYQQLNKPFRLHPSFIQKEKVERGELGRKQEKDTITIQSNNSTQPLIKPF